jgi:hypothetical protein
VYLYLVPESGVYAATSAAIGFELLYIGVNILTLRSKELRQYAQAVALAAVLTAVVFNTLAHYAIKVPEAYTGAMFVPLAALLALITSLPLAGLAYAVSVLLHRLSEDNVSDDLTLASLLSTPVATPHQAQQVTINIEAPTPEPHHALSDSGVTLSGDEVTITPLLSKTERVKRLALSNGWSESKAWREAKRLPELLEEV